ERGVTPRLRSFIVSGIFEAGIADHDASLALAHLADASVLAGLEGRAEGVGIRLIDPLAVSALASAAGSFADPPLTYSD
ncbi:MAG: lipoprotein-releasing system transmembrane subunit LolC, partial [Gammaproteobacteria bacterium]|nr:lipoprotein-releasing system transmembrane subunit LolC [Gammaproteobacteria bacterium]